MREIKFRGKRVDNGEWVFGDYSRYSKYHSIIMVDLLEQEDYWVPSETVGQYTGRKDRNGVDIYEGDIANHKDYECFGKVVFSDDELAFAFLVVTGPTTEFEWLYEYADGLEVIGNIHDNPELMEVRNDAH